MIDLEVLRAYLVDEVLIHRFLTVFRVEAVQSLERLQFARIQGELEPLSREAHSLKSQLRYLGAVPAADLAARLEVLASSEEGNDSEIGETLSNLESALQDVFAAIDIHLS
jgi:HPt (histidine-containing phosphotransfer) domain-containing protein